MAHPCVHANSQTEYRALKALNQVNHAMLRSESSWVLAGQLPAGVYSTNLMAIGK